MFFLANIFDDFGTDFRFVGADSNGPADFRRGAGKVFFGLGMNNGQRFLRINIVADLAEVRKAGCIIQLLVRVDASAFKPDDAHADIPGLHGGNKARRNREYRADDGSGRKVILMFFNKIGRAAQCGNHAGKNFQRFSRIQGLL